MPARNPRSKAPPVRRPGAKAAPAGSLGEVFDRGSLASSETLITVYNRHYEDLSAYALSILRSKERAEDAVQSAFAKTLTAVERGRQIDHVGRWLHRCVHNACIDDLRIRQVEIGGDSELDELSDPADLVETTHWRDRCRDFYRATAGLPEHVRKAFLLAEVQGLSYREIAGEMERSVESVRYLIFRARRHLRETVGRQARGLVTPLMGALGSRHPAEGLEPNEGGGPSAVLRGLARRVHDLFLAKASAAQAQVATLAEHVARLALNPVIPLAVGALVAGGMVDGGSAGRDPTGGGSGPQGVVSSHVPHRTAAGRAPRTDTGPARGEAGSSMPNDSLRDSRPPVPDDGQNVVGGDRQPAESAAGHDEARPEAVGSAGGGGDGGGDVSVPYEDPPTETKEPGAPPEPTPTPPDPSYAQMECEDSLENCAAGAGVVSGSPPNAAAAMPDPLGATVDSPPDSAGVATGSLDATPDPVAASVPGLAAVTHPDSRSGPSRPARDPPAGTPGLPRRGA